MSYYLNAPIYVFITFPICYLISAMSFSVGRGMLTMGTLEPVSAEALPLPPLSLTGRVAPTNALLALDAAASAPELTLWPGEDVKYFCVY